MFDKENSYIYIENPKGEEKRVTISEAEKLFNIEWLEWRKQDCHVNKNFKICFMGNKLGWGLFARKKIKKDTVIGLFTGKVRFQNRDVAIESEHVFLNDAKNNQFQIVDASEAGNITRFIQHLPTLETIKKIKFKELVKSDLAIANVRKRVLNVNNIFTEEYYTDTSIDANSILGCEYDPQFWLENIPFLLTTLGKPIPLELYTYQKPEPDDTAKRRYNSKSNIPQFFNIQNSTKFSLATMFFLILAFCVIVYTSSCDEKTSYLRI